jgi:hypothetical protein
MICILRKKGIAIKPGTIHLAAIAEVVPDVGLGCTSIGLD